MNSTVPWKLLVADRAQKTVARAPRHERERLRAEVNALALDPFGSNTLPLRGAANSYRRRVGDYRILYTVFAAERLIHVTEVRAAHVHDLPPAALTGASSPNSGPGTAGYEKVDRRHDREPGDMT